MQRRGQFGRGAHCRIDDLVGRHDLVEEPGIDGTRRVSHAAMGQRPMHMTPAQPILGDRDRPLGQGHGDRHFGKADACRWGVGSDPQIASEQQQRASRYGMTSAGSHHGNRCTERLADECAAVGHQRRPLRRGAAAHHVEIEPT